MLMVYIAVLIKHNSIKDTLKYNKFFIRKNDFPYHLESNLSHLIFWYNGEINMNEAYRASLSHIPNCGNIILFGNHVKLKSIPELNHYHIIHRESIAEFNAKLLTTTNTISMTNVSTKHDA